MVVISIIHSKERKEKPEIFKFPARWHFFLFTLSWILGILMKYLCINCIFWELTFPTGVNLSVTASPCHLPYRGEALAYRKASPLRQRLLYKGQRRRPPPAAETGRSCWGSGQQDASDSAADAGCRNPALASGARLRGLRSKSLRRPECVLRHADPHNPAGSRGSLPAGCWRLPEPAYPRSRRQRSWRRWT